MRIHFSSYNMYSINKGNNFSRTSLLNHTFFLKKYFSLPFHYRSHIHTPDGIVPREMESELALTYIQTFNSRIINIVYNIPTFIINFAQLSG